MEPYGIDIVASLKNIWEKDPLLNSNNFHIISPNSSFKNLFDAKMDFIFANQSLYYLTKQAFKETVQEFYDLCNEGAIIFATMMSPKAYREFVIDKEDENGLTKIHHTGRLESTTYIRFTKNIEELKEDFKPFKPLFWGDYELINLHNFEGSVEHFIYIGQK